MGLVYTYSAFSSTARNSKTVLLMFSIEELTSLATGEASNSWREARHMTCVPRGVTDNSPSSYARSCAQPIIFFCD